MSRRDRIPGSLAVVAASIFVVQATRGCSPTTESVSVLEDAATSEDARRDGTVHVSRDADAEAPFYTEPDVETPPPPDDLPPGWVAWTDWTPACPIYVPGPGAELPPPIEWEPCPPPFPQELSCRRMKNTWGGTVALTNKLWRDPATDLPYLMFWRTRSSEEVFLIAHIIAEVDGPVQSARLLPSCATCYDCAYFTHDFNDGLWVGDPPSKPEIYPDAATVRMAAFGGPMSSSTPSVLAMVHKDPFWSIHWNVSADWLVRLADGAIIARSWDGTIEKTAYLGGEDPNGLGPHEPLVHGTDIFIDVGNLELCGVMSWSPGAGLRPLLRRYSDFHYAAGNFGTDGQVMVWTQSEGPGACTNDGPNPEVLTAPYTTDPEVLKSTAHRIRKDVRGMSPDRYAVGSGYAARHDCFGTPSTNALFIVRLADGYAWTIPGNDDLENFLYWSETIGFTDEELFVMAGTPDMNGTIVRIRLDSLGPGTPPD